jgi:hypothetical protein
VCSSELRTSSRPWAGKLSCKCSGCFRKPF